MLGVCGCGTLSANSNMLSPFRLLSLGLGTVSPLRNTAPTSGTTLCRKIYYPKSYRQCKGKTSKKQFFQPRQALLSLPGPYYRYERPVFAGL
jgi:hypothetical protein